MRSAPSTMLRAVADGGWRRRAACRGKPTAWWYPGPGESTRQALALCAGCPVRAECLVAALLEEVSLPSRDVVGIRAGLMPTERLVLMGHDGGRRRRVVDDRRPSPEADRRARWQLEDAWEASMRQTGHVEATIRARISLLRKWWTFTDGRPWQARRGDVEAFVAGRRLGPASTANMLSHLSRFYRWAVLEGLTEHDPTVHLERPTASTSTTGVTSSKARAGRTRRKLLRPGA